MSERELKKVKAKKKEEDEIVASAQTIMESIYSATQPKEGVNYNVVCGMHAVGSILCVLLYLINQIFPDFGAGFWIILAPFFPCFLFFMTIRKKWLLNEARIAQEKHDLGTLYGLDKSKFE